MSIQYFGRGPDDEAPDRYMPHCDGDCTGLDFKPGNRMATIVMYCKVPKKGGATNFRNSGVHIKPKQYAATFFSYIDPDTMKMDSGFTEHSGCPVVEGEKKIVTQWVRLGVDDENPWNSFNTRKLFLLTICFTPCLLDCCILCLCSSHPPADHAQQQWASNIRMQRINRSNSMCCHELLCQLMNWFLLTTKLGLELLKLQQQLTVTVSSMY